MMEPTLGGAGGAVPSDETEPALVTDEKPATDAPGATIFVCPACGVRYDEPTECANGHAPTATVEYDRETFDAAAGGDPDAIASVNATATAAAGGTAGVMPAEATPPPVAPEPTPPEPIPVDPVPAPPAAVETVPAPPNVAAIADALDALEAAIRAARTALGLGG